MMSINFKNLITSSCRSCYLVALIWIVATSTVNAQDQKKDPIPSAKFALNAKASTLGAGADLVYAITPKLSARLGVETLKLTFDTSVDEDDLSFDVATSLRTGSISLLMDYHLTKRVFVTGGALLNQFKGTAKGTPTSDYKWGDVVIQREKLGLISVEVTPELSVSPYAGLGFGRLISSDRRFTFAFEAGVLYQGSPQLSLSSSGILAPNSDPDLGQEQKLEDQISEFQLYPVMRFNLGFRLR